MYLKDPSFYHCIEKLHNIPGRQEKIEFIILQQHMNLCSLHVLIVFLFSSTGAAEKPYTVEDAISYNELDYLSVSVLHSKGLSFSLFCLWLELLLLYIDVFLQTRHVVRRIFLKFHYQLMGLYVIVVSAPLPLLSFDPCRVNDIFMSHGDENKMWFSV